MLFAVR